MDEMDTSGKTSVFFELGLRLRKDGFPFLQRLGLLRGSNNNDVGTLAGKERSYRNIAHHSIVVSMVGDIFLEQAEKVGLLTPDQHQRGVRAAFIHDVTKRHELEMEYGKHPGDQKVLLDPVLRRRFDEELLDAYAITAQDKETLALADLSGDGVLWLNDKEITELKIDQTPESLIRYVIFLSDYMVAHDDLVSPEARMSEASKRGEYNDLSVWWYKRLYGQDQFEAIKNQPDFSANVNRMVYGKTSMYLAETDRQIHTLLSIDPQTTLLDFVQNELTQRYKTAIEKNQARQESQIS